MSLTAGPVVLSLLAGGVGVAVGIVASAISLRLRRGAAPEVGGRRLFLALAGAAVGVWAVVSQPSIVAAGLTALLGWQLLLVALVDGEHFWLPDQLTFPLAGTGLTAAAILDRLAMSDSIVGAAAGFGGLWLLARAYRVLRGREGLGGGDPFLLAAGGAWTGWVGLPSVLLWAAAAGLSVAAARLVTGGRVTASDRLPFGVFLAVGIWLTWLWGPLGLPN